MGTWGAGNFDNDTAMDHLYEVAQPLVEQIERFLADPTLMDHNPPDGDTLGDVAMANIELLCRIAGSTRDPAYAIRGGMLPPPETVEEWKSRFLAAWDVCIDGYSPRGGYKEQRRAVIVATFDQLLELSRIHHWRGSNRES
jgi:hypothetical protein